MIVLGGGDFGRWCGHIVSLPLLINYIVAVSCSVMPDSSVTPRTIARQALYP